MKHIFSIAALLSCILPALLSFSQVPTLFNYQGIARAADGTPLANQQISLKFAILPTADALLPEYEETQKVPTNAFGLYSVQIGNGTSTTLRTIKDVKWETGNKYIKVSIDPSGGTNFVDLGTNQLLSVPYALYAEKSGGSTEIEKGKTRAGAVSTSAAGTGTVNFLPKFTAANTIFNSQIFDNGTNVGIGTTTPGAKLHLHTATGSVEHLRMQNLNPTGFGKFLLYNDNISNYATFTKYGSGFAGGATGIASQYPFANMFGFGNNGGPTLLSNSGNVGIGVIIGGATQLKFNANNTTGYLGLGGNALPAAKVHFNTGTTNDTIKFTNSTTGHLATDGLEIRTVGNTANIINRENSTLNLGTFDSSRVTVLGNGNVGIGVVAPTTKLDVNGTLRIRGGSPQAGYILTSDALGNASWQVPGGSPGIFPGTAKGNTPYWNDTIWVNNSNTLYNNGSKIGIGTNAPGQLFSVKNKMMVDSNGSVKIGAGVILPNTPFSVNNRMMVDSNGTIKMALDSNKVCIDVSACNNDYGYIKLLKGSATGQQGLSYSNNGLLGNSEFMFKDSAGSPYLFISDDFNNSDNGLIYLFGNFYSDSVITAHIQTPRAKIEDIIVDTLMVNGRLRSDGTSTFINLYTANPVVEVKGQSLVGDPILNGIMRVETIVSDPTDNLTGIIVNITPDTTQVKGTGIQSDGCKVGLIANAFNNGTSALTHAIEATASNNGSNTGLLVKAKNRGTVSGTKTAINAQATGGSVNNAALMTGDVTISGNLAKGGGTFKIDHPQDPENKYLIHSFVESPDMMNVYNGNIVSDANGVATVALPSYFEVENKDFKYQLTVIDNSADFVMAKVSKKINNNSFEIKTSKPNIEVSWQVTGVRKDKWAEAHRVVPELEKEARYKGSYLHPELYGKSAEEGILIQMGNENELSIKK
ncbi:MAG: hypothetical protein IPK62_06655 [Bacteroidetes bacterium]|nr:hypothetical protein [Bacteroidota bacterium]